MDDVIIAAATGTAYTGVDGSTSTAYDTGMTVAVTTRDTGVSSANYGLNIAKLIAAKELLDANGRRSRTRSASSSSRRVRSRRCSRPRKRRPPTTTRSRRWSRARSTRSWASSSSARQRTALDGSNERQRPVLRQVGHQARHRQGTDRSHQRARRQELRHPGLLLHVASGQPAWKRPRLASSLRPDRRSGRVIDAPGAGAPPPGLPGGGFLW
jgi:hypothetical protein